MNAKDSKGLLAVAVVQFVALFVLPWSVLSGISPVILILGPSLFGFLGYSLYRRRSWSRVATVFVQGMNIIVRLLTTISQVVSLDEAGTHFDWPLMITALVSVALSAGVMYYIDQPEMELLMKQGAEAI